MQALNLANKGTDAASFKTKEVSVITTGTILDRTNVILAISEIETDKLANVNTIYSRKQVLNLQHSYQFGTRLQAENMTNKVNGVA